MSDPLKPSASLLVKLGSIVVHTEEMLGPNGHHFDVATLKSMLADPELDAWRDEMGSLALLPVKR